MRVLLTNDDGYDSLGLQALRAVLEQEHEVWTLAPDGERSGTSHCITSDGVITLHQIGDRLYKTSGTPADCVILGLTGGELPDNFDAVLSGINIGANLGTDIVYSGTAAAARQASLMGVPGIALSLVQARPPYSFTHIAAFALRNLTLFCDLWDSQHFININAPNDASAPTSVEVTTLAWRLYSDRPKRVATTGNQKSYYFMNSRPRNSSIDPGTDWHAVEHGAISVSPVYINPVLNGKEQHYRQALVPRSDFA